MASFTDVNLVRKLHDLNPSQQSIQTLSLWIIHHRKHAKKIVEVWMKELRRAKSPKKLTYLYLANDVVQTSRKKGPEFHTMFKHVLPDAYKHALKEAAEKMKGSMERMVNIWEERNVFDTPFIKQMKGFFDKTFTKPTAPPKKRKQKIAEVNLIEEIKAELENEGFVAPPDADDLVQALEDLEYTASTDAAVREKIAALPPGVSDVSLLSSLQDKDEAEKLMEEVEDARLLLADYNFRLTAELEQRKKVSKMLHTFVNLQKTALTESEKRLQEYQEKLEQVSLLRRDLKNHLAALPDLSKLSASPVGSLAPLPSAGDLFAV